MHGLHIYLVRGQNQEVSNQLETQDMVQVYQEKKTAET